MKPIWTAAVLAVLTCNQGIYDQIYRQIIRDALSSQANTKIIFAKRNAAIENLRSLCNGQLSSYERPSSEHDQANLHWD